MSGRSARLLICCKAFRANLDAFDNLTVKKIPQSVMQKCEWGRDDYSLAVASLPPAAVPPEGEPEAAPAAEAPPADPPKRRGRPRKPAPDQPSFLPEEG